MGVEAALAGRTGKTLGVKITFKIMAVGFALGFGPPVADQNGEVRWGHHSPAGAGWAARGEFTSLTCGHVHGVNIPSAV